MPGNGSRVGAVSGGDRKVEIVNEHMRLENAYDFPGAIGTFARPRYEVVTDGELWDGASGVDAFLSQNHKAFPDFVFEPTRVSPTTDAVLVEGRFKGTHLGTWHGWPATGRRFRSPMLVRIPIAADGLMEAEVVYNDSADVFMQLGILPRQGSRSERAMQALYRLRRRLPLPR